MVTKSIVGRFLILAVLLASLGVIGQAAFKISQQSGRAVARVEAPAPRAVPAPPAPAKRDVTPAVFVPAAEAAAPTPADAAPIRVVYPGPLGDAPAQPRKAPDAAAASPLPAPAQPAPAVQAVAVVPAAPVPAPPGATAANPVQVASAGPSAGTSAAGSPVQAASAPPVAPSPAPAAGRGGVNLNSASAEALNRVGGGHIGQAIVAHRPYRSVEDLVTKRVVKRSVYEQIKDQLAAE